LGRGQIEVDRGNSCNSLEFPRGRGSAWLIPLSQSVSPQEAGLTRKADGGCRAASDNFSGAAHFALNSCIYIRTVTNVKNLLVGKPFLAIE
jgi:hypothetical protein